MSISLKFGTDYIELIIIIYPFLFKYYLDSLSRLYKFNMETNNPSIPNLYLSGLKILFRQYNLFKKINISIHTYLLVIIILLYI